MTDVNTPAACWLADLAWLSSPSISLLASARNLLSRLPVHAIHRRARSSRLQSPSSTSRSTPATASSADTAAAFLVFTASISGVSPALFRRLTSAPGQAAMVAMAGVLPHMAAQCRRPWPPLVVTTLLT